MRRLLRFALAIALFATVNSGLLTSLRAQSSDGPAVIQAVAPVFPIPDKGNIAVGRVAVEVQLDSNGVVTAAKAVQGHPDLYAICESAAKRWVFAASPDSGARTVRLTFVFHVMEDPTRDEDLGPIFSLPYKVEIRSNGRIVTTRETY